MPNTSQTALPPIGSDLVQEDPSFTDIVVRFVEGLTDRMEKMEQAIRASDFEALRVAAHQLKGSGGGYGYPSLTDKARAVEDATKADDMETARLALNELQVLILAIVAGHRVNAFPEVKK